MLFLAAGRIDYCLVRLETGRIKVHINVGAGETEVASPKGLRLDDLTWHKVEIIRKDASFTLKVDTIHEVKKKLPGNFFELNIHYGLFLGGQGEFSELFLGHLESLRGCLSDVKYNDVNVLARARERQGQVDVQGITWSCAPEFDAGVEKDISFVEEGGFVALPNVITRTGARWQFEMKTILERGILLYNTGLASRSDFVGVELNNGRLRILLDKGNGATELQGETFVSDGNWHSVSIQFNPTFVEISVDGVAASRRMPQGGNRYLDLAEMAYLGGLDVNKRARALNQGLRSAGSSYKGCLRNIEVDAKRVGIPNAKITQGILPECMWEYPCAREPCITGARCLQQGVDSFRCDCDEPLCIKPDYADSYKVFSKPMLPVNLEILNLTPLQVSEGENSLVTTENIDVVLDFAKYGIRDSGVLVHVVDSPEHGKLYVSTWDRNGVNLRQTFTLLDITKDKVHYIHDGSENHADTMVFELELVPGSGFILPGYLQGRHRFALHVNVTPVNDPPTINLPPGAAIRLAQGTRKVLSNSILKAQDPDSPSASLVYTVLSQNGQDSSHVEKIDQPGVAIQTFTQTEVDQEQIVYAHSTASGEKNRLTLQVSDGIETSPPTFLHISAFPLQLRLVNNTGLVITRNGGMPISPANLGFETNSEDSSLDIRYDIVKTPQYGRIERLRGDAQWQATDYFTSRQLARDQIRYLHSSGEPSHDEFKFKVSVLEVYGSTVYDFRITFTELRLVKDHIHELQLNGTREGWITNQQLQYRTEPLPTDGVHIMYRITRAPHYGTLHSKHHRLQNGDTFTQQDVDSVRIRYRLHRKSYSHVRDEFSFTITAPDCDEKTGTMSFLHVPSGETRSKVHATLERLQVPEGGRQALLSTHLLIETHGITNLEYNVTHPPKHGQLDVMDETLQTDVRKGTLYFTSEELFAKRVYYVHDDSETKHDSFHFVALSSEEEDFQYVGVFHIDILLKNDNTPVRTIDKVFHIVSGGEKLLTGNDLRYSDADIDTRPSDIIYTRRGIQNGGIYKASDPTVPLYEFSQDDLDHRRVLFRHEGEEYSKVGLWVRDGQFYANGFLEVKASPPFVAVVNNTGLIVKHGGIVPITSYNLSVETNLNLWGESIVFELIENLKHGHLEIEHGDEPIQRFTILDLEEEQLVYHHDSSMTASDMFRFRVTAEETTTEGKFNIKIFPAIFWETLIVTNNRTIQVEESTSVVISSDSLKVTYPGILPTDITYFVVERPAYGYLSTDTSEDDDEVIEKSLDIFDQSLLNEGHLIYVQAVANRSRDHFVVDITNGVSWLRGLIVNLVVVPERIYISGGELKVSEGATVSIQTSMLITVTEYYKKRVTDYKVLEPPKSGMIQSSREPGTPLYKFTTAQLEAGLIQYCHDGSESLSDQIVVVGIAGEKESVPATVRIVVIPVNDELPQIVNNTGVSMWKGGSVTITSENLAATDKDTPPENLTFTVMSPRFGYVALVSSPSHPIERFTQVNINNNEVMFVHTGGEGGSMTLTVTDGVQTTAPTNFPIVARRVEIKLSSRPLLHVFPLRRQSITQLQLHATATDPVRIIYYTVTTKPVLGLLQIFQHNIFQECLNFTQQDVDEGRIFYKHTHPFFGFSTNDSFAFEVRTDFAEPLMDQEMVIDISIASGGLKQLLNIPKIEVDEGGSIPLHFNMSGIINFLTKHADVGSPTVSVQIASAPHHGEIIVNGDSNSSSFTQFQLDYGNVIYQHDGSDTLEDEISVSLILDPGSILLCNGTIPITIRPINDQPFRLATPAPRISVVQGQNVTITQHDLLTVDPDTEPENLFYDIITVPSQGELLLQRNKTDVSPAVKFTQADINSGHIVYKHSGPLQPATFYFRVSDGRFNPVYTIFNIHVTPLTLNVTVMSLLLLEQGSSVVFITTDHLHMTTNGDREQVLYNITEAPNHGKLYVQERDSRSFTQSDLEGKYVMYMQTDMTTANDSFTIMASLGETVMKGLVLTMVVTPLLHIGNFSPITGSLNRLTLEILDATPLAKLTNSNPTFRILHKPRLGKIKKIIKSSGEKRNVREREVTRFTHEELRSGVIYYAAKKIPENTDSEDEIPFLLAASIFQPAIGELRFKILQEKRDSSLQSKGVLSQGPRDPVSRESDHMVASPNMSSDYLLIVSMVLGVVLLAVLVIVIVKCRSVQMAKEDSRQKTDPNILVPLARPPDDPRAGSPTRTKRFIANNTTSPAVPPLPTPNSHLQCKVIPLEAVDSVASSDIDLNSRYPYGVADEPVEDWSSYDTSELGYPPRTNNPMLRRNQYWV